MDYALGVDIGASKTEAVIATTEGTVVGWGRAGGANFGVVGVEAAQEEARAAVEAARRSLPTGAKIEAAFYGVGQADRPEDYSIIEQFLRPMNPARRMRFDNDALIVLKLGTRDGVGTALISGTGSNAVGVNRQGQRLHVGWLPFGERASGAFIVSQALAAAARGMDGRGPSTCLTERIPALLGLASLPDLIVFQYHDEVQLLDRLQILPLVFAVADEGDLVAEGILADVAEELCLCTQILVQRLFAGEELIPVVVGGGVFRLGERTIMKNLRELLRQRVPHACLVKPDLAPAFGALFYAIEDAGMPLSDDLVKRLSQSARTFSEAWDAHLYG